MAGGGYQDEGGAIVDINVTPLVDVVLVLLVVLMVTAPMIAARGIQVDSPKTVSGGEVSGSLKLTLEASGVLHVDGTPYAPEAWASARVEIERRHSENADIKAIIEADRAIDYGEVMEVIDLVKLAGVTKFALATERKTDDDTD